MPSAFEHGPALTVPASNTTAKAAVIWSAASNLGESTIILDSGGNGRIGIAGDLDTITITSGTVTVAGTVAATTLTGAGSGITALNGTQITSGTVPVARLGSGSPGSGNFLRGDGSWQAAGGDFSNGGDAGALVLGTNDSNSLTFETNNTARITIESGGNVGVGTTSPSGIFHVAKSGDTKMYVQCTSSSDWAALQFLGNGGTARAEVRGSTGSGRSDAGSLYLLTSDTYRMAITADGEVTMPSQPAFSAFNNATLADQTGNGANPTIRFNAEHFDIGSNFNTSTSTFTAPVTGIYLLMVRVYWDGRSSASHQYAVTILTNNRNYENQWDLVSGTSGFQIQDQVLTHMTAGHTATVKAAIYGEGSNQVDLVGDAAGRHTTFQGYLVA